MNRIHSEFIKADELLYEFAEKTEKFEERYKHLMDDVNVFIERNDFDGFFFRTNLSGKRN